MTDFSWITHAHVAALAIFGLIYIQPDTLFTWVRWGAFGYFLLASGDVVLSMYHHHNLSDIPPEAKRYALITGATSILGREISYILADRKYSLILASHADSTLERMRSEITRVHRGVDVQNCVCDLGTQQGIDKLLRYIDDNKLVVDVLVNSAVDVGDPHLFQSLTEDQVHKMLSLNLVATTRVTHSIVKQMQDRGIGRILNLSTLSFNVPSPTAAIYGASKAFITNFSHALHYELRATDITVTCFHHGPLEYTGREPKDRKLGQLWPWAIHPTDAATYAVDAMFRADESGYDTYINQILSFMLCGWFPRRIGQLLVAMTRQNTVANAFKLIKR